MKQKDDYLWKEIIESFFEDFLRFLHPDVDKIVDFRRGFRFVDRRFERLFPSGDDNLVPGVVDKLAQVYTCEGKKAYVLIHLEGQKACHKDFAKRMYRYFRRIFINYNTFSAIHAILTDAGKRQWPNFYKDKAVRFSFATCKIAEQDDKSLLASDNPFALVVLSAKALIGLEDTSGTDEALLKTKIRLARELVARKIGKKKTRVLINFLRYYVRFDSLEASAEFDKEVEKLAGKGATGPRRFLPGHARMAKGKKERNTRAAVRMLKCPKKLSPPARIS